MKFFSILLFSYMFFILNGQAKPFEMKVEQIHSKIGDEINWKDLRTPPSDWSTFEGEIPKNGEPYWVLIKFNLSGDYAEGLQTFLMHIRSSSAYQLYWDGQLVNDLIGSQDINEPDIRVPYYSFIVLSAEQISSGKHIAVMRMNGALDQNHVNILFEAEDYSKSGFERFWWVASVLLLVSVAIITALYFITLYVASKGGDKPLFGGLLCLSISLITLFDNADWLFAISYQEKLIFDYILQFFATILFFLLPYYLCLVFNIKKRLKIMGVILLIFLISFASIDLLPDHDVRAFSYLLFFCAGLSFSQIKPAQYKAIFIGVGMLACLLVFQVDDIFKHLMLLVLILILTTELATDLWFRQKQKHQIELNASRLQTELLKRNIQPHFLMNSLTAVMEWIETDPEMGMNFIEELANEFRKMASFADKKMVLISEEIELCRIHLRLMSMRLKENYEIDIQNIDQNKMIPPVIFHTLLENAISHNKFTDHNGKIVFKIIGEDIKNKRTYSFFTPYQPKEYMANGSGTGMSYIKARLEEAYPKNWSISDQYENNYWRTDIQIWGDQ